MAEATTLTPRPRGLLALSLVFLLGMACGAALVLAGGRLLSDAPLFARFGGGHRGGRMPIARMTRQLDLDPQQQEQVRAVIERGHAEVREVLERSRSDIRSLLRPEQQEKFDRMRPPRPPFPRARPHAVPPD